MTALPLPIWFYIGVEALTLCSEESIEVCCLLSLARGITDGWLLACWLVAASSVGGSRLGVLRRHLTAVLARGAARDRIEPARDRSSRWGQFPIEHSISDPMQHERYRTHDLIPNTSHLCHLFAFFFCVGFNLAGLGSRL